jgi:hypothetical protein
MSLRLAATRWLARFSATPLPIPVKPVIWDLSAVLLKGTELVEGACFPEVVAELTIRNAAVFVVCGPTLRRLEPAACR